ncbi:hypothetical protein P3G55_13120 [Leptospira sp. 96542]|nr:hypothetical protein [Leptospira sp. 96542]
MKKIISILVFCIFFSCSKKVAQEFSRFNGYYYMHSTLLKFEDFGLTKGLDYEYIIFDQANSKISAINYKTNSIEDFLVSDNGEGELVMKMNHDIYFNFEAEDRGDRIARKITFYKNSKDLDNSFLTYGYMEEDIKSLSDMQNRIAERQKENEIFEENLPPGQE